jgi:two-component system, cell cycle sensor histidine kinase and response regulator CckA
MAAQNTPRAPDAPGDLSGRAQVFRNIFERSPIGIALMDLDGRLIESNEAFCAMVGYTAAELGSLTVFDLTHPDDRAAEAAGLEESLRAGNRARRVLTEKRYLHKDGRIIWGRLNACIIRDAKGLPILGLGLVEDITERKQAEQALRESEERYRLLFSEMLSGFALHEIVCDEHGKPVDYRFLEVNPAFERITGLSRDAILGRCVREVLPGIGNTWVERYGAVAQTGMPVHFDDYFEGLRKHFDIIAYSPKAGQFAVIFSDITEKQKMEEEQIRAERLESLGSLAGGIAHDFNNLLTAILGNISLARSFFPAEASRDAADLLEEAERASLRAKDLTQQLLTFARGGTPIKQKLPLGGVIREAAEFALHGSASKVEFTLGADLWPAEIDPGQIGQVIRNLVINADQAMPGGGTLAIAAANAAFDQPPALPLPAGRYVKITVSDQGMGIDPKLADKVFDPYFTTKKNGSGLGLATSRSIIRKHGGHITLRSILGRGTTFEIYLPATAEAAATPAAPPAPPPTNAPGAVRVLLMDDEQAIRQLAARILKGQGYDSATAPDGAAAVRLCGEALKAGKPFQVAILDLTIQGGMGGKEALRRLREIDPDLKAIVSSGYSTDPVMSRYRDFGFQGVVAKPYQTETLLATIRQVLELRA